MSLETDALAQAASQFSQAIRSERQATLDALGAERQAALDILNEWRRQQAERDSKQEQGGDLARFVVGFLVGAALGAAFTVVLKPNMRALNRERLSLRAQSARSGLKARWAAALEAGQRASTTREQELWDEFRQRQIQPPPPPDEAQEFE